VAEIVADTMNNYLLFGHILKVYVVPKGQVHERLWKGANRRFKSVPWNKIQGRRLETARPKDDWDKKVQAERKRREEKALKLKELGYEYEPAKLKGVEDLSDEELKLTETGEGPALDKAV